MAKTVSSLSINVSASTATLATDFRKATGIASQFTADITGMAAKLGGIFAGAFAFNTLQQQFTGVVSRVDELTRKAADFGMSANGLQTVQVAAQNLDVDVDAVNKSLFTLTRELGNIRTEGAASKEFEEALGKIGMSGRELAQQGTGDALRTIADALAAIPDPATRASVGYGLLGKQSRELLQVLSQGSGVFDDAEAKLKKFGLALDGDALATMAAADDAFDDLSLAAQGFWQQLTITAAPAVTTLIVQVTDLLAWINNLDAAVVKEAAEWIAFAGALGGAIILIPRIVSGVTTLVTTLRTLATTSALVTALSGPGGWATLAVGLGAGMLAVQAIDQAFEQTTVSAKTMDAATKSAAGGMADGFKEAAEAARDIKKELEAADKALNRQAESLTESLMTPLEKFEAAQWRAQELFDQGKITEQTLTRAQAKAKADLDAALPKLERTAKALDIGGNLGAAGRGTTQEFEAIRAGAQAYQQMTRAANSQLAEQRRANSLLQTIATEIPKIDLTVQEADF